MNAGTIIPELILGSTKKLREFLGLETKDCSNHSLPRIVTRKDPSLDNYFAELLLRTSYRQTRNINDFQEIVMRGSDEELPASLNPQVERATLIGIGGRIKDKENRGIWAYDEHSFEGTRRADSASQMVFWRHFDKYKNVKPGVRSILPILNHINDIDSKGTQAVLGKQGGRNHLIHVTKTLHHCVFQRPGYLVEEFPAQWKRAIIQSILTAICLEQEYLWNLDLDASTKRYRNLWQAYYERRSKAVEDGYLPAISKDTLGSVLVVSGAANPKNEPKNHIFSLNRCVAAMEKVWGEGVALFVMGFLMESMLQGQEEYTRIRKIDLDEVFIPEIDCSLIYYVMSPIDMMPHRAINRRITDSGRSSILVIKDLQRNIMALFGGSLPANKWKRFVDWLKTTEPDNWYVPVDVNTKKLAAFTLNGTRYYLGSEPTALGKEEFIEGIREAYN